MAALLSILVATVYAQTAPLDMVLSRLDHPQDGDREVVNVKGTKAFEVLYPMAIARARLLKTRRANPDVAEARLATTVSYLCLSADAGQTEKLLKLYDKVDERSQASLVFWFAQTGNANSIRSLFGRLFAEAVEGEGTGLSDQIVAGLIRPLLSGNAGATRGRGRGNEKSIAPAFFRKNVASPPPPIITSFIINAKSVYNT